MNVEIIKTTRLILELTEEECRWLHFFIEEEIADSTDLYNKKMAKKFIDATSIILG